ncbi:pentatricopeptide repeat-containing protein At2g17033 [Punica granatum]|uniref:Pentatricopeptide repeat-containing protein At2g17033 n=2 Tax=Punica granatum TaxID=22663 RepID=A0A6P8CIG2_PUNGR|nr:pentatricopeptide repeat-containing protein At2g17033 [Punica granatum]PKI59828.1 hypothetical protein CRG98_019776 [Punica granatum]
MDSLRLRHPPQLPWNSRCRCRHRHRHFYPQPQATPPAPVHCALSKQGQRLVHSLTLAAGDAAATDRLMKKFIAGSPKSVALNALSHLLSPGAAQPNLSFLALPFYLRIREASWYKWNPKLVAELIALLDKQGKFEESDELTAETVSKFEFRERDLALFYCNLIESHAKHKSDRGFHASFAYLQQLLRNSASVYVKKRAYESIICGLCEMGRPIKAENIIVEVRPKGILPSAFEFRTLVYAYGKSGLLPEMLRLVDSMESEGFEIDTVCSNMVLSSYGAHGELTQMVHWLQRMKLRGVPFSIRTYNTVLNSCPTIVSMTKNTSDSPVSIEELKEVLDGQEALLVRELIDSPIINEAMEWSTSEAKLDLHGMHLGSAYVILLQWMEEMKRKLGDGKAVVPEEVTIICGSGKHSSIRGESPIKGMVRELLIRAKSPMRIDRKNNGCLVAKGRVFRDWQCKR